MKRPHDDELEVVGAKRTLSIALPASIIDNAQTPELRMYLAGQVARAAAIFCVGEVVVFNDGGTSEATMQFLCTALRYAETPQYLRKHLFGRTALLRHAGLLNPLALPHHHARGDLVRYREGCYVGRGDRPAKYVDVGLERLAEVERAAPPGTRVTVDLADSGDDYSAAPGKYLYGRTCKAPGYWGYAVRTAASLSDVFSSSPGQYDLVVGTSERGDPVAQLPPCSNALIVFGGVQGLEHAAKNDPSLPSLGVSEPSEVGELFDYYINTCADQGSRTIRTEEALLISLAAITPFLRSA